MKNIIAVASHDFKTVFDHAGKCRNFLIYTIINDNVEKKEKLYLTREETLHNIFHNNDQKISSILLEADILLTRGIGNGAIQKLAKHNVTCYKIEETDPDIAIEKLLNGTLEAMSPVSNNESGCNCGGNHHHPKH